MSTKRMLIDASHSEETRVVIADGNRLEDFDVEAEARQQLKGNIYLAKVTRVEPSLQACFVDYGGNRHGFLAFNEIHPDYYQIPVADREALVAEEQAEDTGDGDNGDDEDASGVETVGGDDDEDVQVRRPVKTRRQYKIQEVIKRRQILLVQVVKEERGNKGAALTTYLSLAGRYCVLMPNTARGGGISRKIVNGTDRKRLKKILSELEIPGGMAVIVRTAGSKRTKAEIQRDYEYLMRLFSQVRETTLQSIAPCLVHEEGDIVKRAIRDLYTKEIDEVIVEGGDAYRQAKDFMKLLIPSHAKKVKRYAEESMPMLQRYQVENQLDAMHSPEVQLKSGGYIVINPTEALVAIDVNSGRATKERNIEETALKTNLEAADEIARQLRLRDLAGLIVIDFIDMEVNRNQSKVERAVKDAMRADRARIQIGRISPFGLLELSRQRLRPSLFETSFSPCPHCGGTGARRSTESSAVQMLRVLEEEGVRRRSSAVTLHVPTSIALYVFNQKRDALAEIEQRYSFKVTIEADDGLIPPDYRLERVKQDAGPDGEETIEVVSGGEQADEEGGKRRRRRRSRRRKRGGEAADIDQDIQDQDAQDQDDDQKTGEAAEQAAEGDTAEATSDDDEPQPKRRRRGRRGGRRRRRAEAADVENTDSDTAEASSDAGDANSPAIPGEGEQPDLAPPPSDAAANTSSDAGSDDTGANEAANSESATPAAEEEAPKPRRRRRRRKADTETSEPAAEDKGIEDAATPASSEASDGSVEEMPPADSTSETDEKPAKPKRPRRKKASAPRAKAADKAADKPAETASAETAATETPEPASAPEPAPPAAPEEVAAAAAAAPAPSSSSDPDDPAIEDAKKTTVIEVSGGKAGDAPARKGWWQRLLD